MPCVISHKKGLFVFTKFIGCILNPLAFSNLLNFDLLYFIHYLGIKPNDFFEINPFVCSFMLDCMSARVLYSYMDITFIILNSYHKNFHEEDILIIEELLEVAS